jgi:hypothetical protein
MALGWAGLCLTFFVFFVAQMSAMTKGFASMERRFTKLEERLGDKDGGLVKDVNDHETRLRRAEESILRTPQRGRLGGAISDGSMGSGKG